MATIHFLSAYSSCSHYHHILATRYLTDDSFCFLFSIAEIFGLDITRYDKRILHIAHHFRMLLSTAKIIIYFELCKLHNANCIIHIDFSYYRGKVSFKSYNFPSKYITIFHTPTSFESSDKNKGIERLKHPIFCSLLGTRPIVVRFSSTPSSCQNTHNYLITSTFFHLLHIYDILRENRSV